MLLKAEKMTGAAAAGRDYVARPLYSFKPPQGGYCMVYTHGSDRTLDTVFKSLIPAQKISYLPIVIDQMLQGLAYMHAANVAHNDIKPQSKLR
jgi:serine/threonine protein kinase